MCVSGHVLPNLRGALPNVQCIRLVILSYLCFGLPKYKLAAKPSLFPRWQVMPDMELLMVRASLQDLISHSVLPSMRSAMSMLPILKTARFAALTAWAWLLRSQVRRGTPEAPTESVQ